MSFKLLDKEHSRDRDLELRKKKKKSLWKKKKRLWYNIQQDTNFNILIFWNWNTNNIILIFLGMKDEWKFKIKNCPRQITNNIREIVTNSNERIEENVLN